MKTLPLLGSGLLIFSASQASANWFWWMGPQSPTQTSSQNSYQSKKGFDFADLKQLINEKQIYSVEDLMPHLPVSLRSNFALMPESESAQGASFENPRALLFGEDARMVLTVNGDPSQVGHNKVEVMEFNDDTREFVLKSVTFPDPKSPNKNVAFAERNPKECLGCHGGSDPRPNWASYPKWKTAKSKAYGHLDDTLSDDREAFIKFLEKKDQSPVYRHLIFEGSNVNPYAPYAGPYGTPKGTGRFRPNMRLTSFFIRQNAKRLMRKMESHPRFDTYQSLILFLREQSHEIGRTNNPKAKGDRIPEQVWALLEKEKLFSREEISALKNEYLMSSVPELVDRIAKALGTDYYDWSLRLVPLQGASEKAKSAMLGTYRDGFTLIVNGNMTDSQRGYSIDYVENELWKNLTKKDPSFAKYYSQVSTRALVPEVYGGQAFGRTLDEMGGLIDVKRSRGSDKFLLERMFPASPGAAAAAAGGATCITTEVKKSLKNWPY